LLRATRRRVDAERVTCPDPGHVAIPAQRADGVLERIGTRCRAPAAIRRIFGRLALMSQNV
jgi:hypothetical protein